MKKPKLSRSANIIFWSAIFFALSIIIGTVYSFSQSGRLYLDPTKIDPLIFGQFGDFIGGLCSSILNLATLIFLYFNLKEQKVETAETKRLAKLQIDSAFKPDLYILDTNILAYSDGPEEEKMLPLNLFNKRTENKGEGINLFSIKMINVGVAIAKNIKYHWEYDVLEFSNYIKSNFDIEEFGFNITPDKNFLEFGFRDKEVFYSINFFKQTNVIDILLPFSTDNHTSLHFPSPYIEMWLVALHFALKSKKMDVFNTLENFPNLKLNVSYDDIAGNNHPKSFGFKLLFSSYSYAKNKNEIMLDGTIKSNEI